MRINNQEFPTASLNVVGEEKIVGITGIKRVFLYEALIKRGAVTQKKRSKNLGELQCWIMKNAKPKAM